MKNKTAIIAELVQNLEELLKAYEDQMHDQYDYPNRPWSPGKEGDEIAPKIHSLLARIKAQL